MEEIDVVSVPMTDEPQSIHDPLNMTEYATFEDESDSEEGVHTHIQREGNEDELKALERDIDFLHEKTCTTNYFIDLDRTIHDYEIDVFVRHDKKNRHVKAKGPLDYMRRVEKMIEHSAKVNVLRYLREHIFGKLIKEPSEPSVEKLEYVLVINKHYGEDKDKEIFIQKNGNELELEKMKKDIDADNNMSYYLQMDLSKTYDDVESKPFKKRYGWHEPTRFRLNGVLEYSKLVNDEISKNRAGYLKNIFRRNGIEKFIQK